MITKEQIREARISVCYDMAKEVVSNCHKDLDFVMKVLESDLNDAELTGDARYCALASLFSKLEEAKEVLNAKNHSDGSEKE